MPRLAVAYEIAQLIHSAADLASLKDVLDHARQRLGFDYFAVHLQPVASHRARHLRLHNYPGDWERFYDARQFGVADPVHRASHCMASGFRWRDIPKIIPVGDRDSQMMSEARAFGLVDGFTVPAHVPGEHPGCVTFAFSGDHGFADDMLLIAEGLGHLVFQQARMLTNGRPRGGRPRVTDRQLEIVALIGQDKTNGEIGDILGIKEDTVMKHVHNICERLDAVRRTSLPLKAVYEGLLIFSDILVQYQS
jgi:DNA-binding CsgD family transcriptional regulator